MEGIGCVAPANSMTCCFYRTRRGRAWKPRVARSRRLRTAVLGLAILLRQGAAAQQDLQLGISNRRAPGRPAHDDGVRLPSFQLLFRDCRGLHFHSKMGYLVVWHKKFARATQHAPSAWRIYID